MQHLSLVILIALLLLHAVVSEIEINEPVNGIKNSILPKENQFTNAKNVVYNPPKPEQIIRLPGHFTLDEVVAISFPSSKVLVTGRVVPELFHVICLMKDSRAECVSTLEKRGLYIDSAALMDECFEPASKDDRFVIATPVRNNVCILNITIGEQQGLLERIFNEHKPQAPRMSQWSIDVPLTQEYVNAYDRIVQLMKKHRLDFSDQIITRDMLRSATLLSRFDNFYDMIDAETNKCTYKSCTESSSSYTSSDTFKYRGAHLSFSSLKEGIKGTTFALAIVADHVISVFSTALFPSFQPILPIRCHVFMDGYKVLEALLDSNPSDLISGIQNGLKDVFNILVTIHNTVVPFVNPFLTLIQRVPLIFLVMVILIAIAFQILARAVGMVLSYLRSLFFIIMICGASLTTIAAVVTVLAWPIFMNLK